MNAPAETTGEPPARGWRDALRTALDRRVVIMTFLGFAAGAPLLLVFGTLSIWLREAGVERATISLFSWAALAYAFKFAWAPVVDTLPLPILTRWLGKRRGWLLLAQGAIIGSLLLMAATDPQHHLQTMAVCAAALGFAAATQDIVIDAYRIELAPPELQSLLSAAYIAGYRVGMLVAGFGALELAGVLDTVEGYSYAAWQGTYTAMAAVMGIGVLTTLVVREPASGSGAERAYGPLQYLRFVAVLLIALAVFLSLFLAGEDWVDPASDWLRASTPLGDVLSGFAAEAARFLGALAAAVAVGMVVTAAGLVPPALMRETYVNPFADVFRRFGAAALWILALVALYRVSDVVLGVIANVFYTDIGFAKAEIGRITKAFGLGMTLAGGFLGGLLSARYGVMRVLMLGAILAAGTNLLFVVLAQTGDVLWMLATVIAADNLSAGIATTAFVAYLSSLTNRAFSASQYAVFSSLMLILPKLIAGYSGRVVDAFGYTPFFIGTALIGLPVIGLIIVVTRRDAT